MFLLGECEGLRGSLEQSQQLLQEAKRNEENEGQLAREHESRFTSATREAEEVRI